MDLKQKEVKEEMEVEAKRLVNSFKYAGTGIFTSFKTEKNMKIHFLIMFLVIIFGFVFHISLNEWITCIILFAGVIAAEMFNTAIENLVDLITPYKNPKAKIVKDIAAGGVLVWAICSAIIGLMIFIPKIIELF